MHIVRPILLIVAAWLALLGDIANARADRRVALVVGNSAYTHTPPLANPANDATVIAAALRRLGFEVIAEVNLTKAKMDDAFRRFARAIDGADTALFYYAGHGLQFGGVNYLMPVDAKLRHEADLPYEMAKVDDVLADMARVKGVRMMVLDACRDNPLDASLKRSAARTRNVPATRGLARIARTKGLLVAYATQPGQVAEDGEGGNSPFTSALLRHLETPNLEVGPMFRRVLADVNGKTKGKQTPELSVSLLGEFYFKGSASDVASPGNTATEKPRSALNERTAFETAKDVDTIAAWDAFLKRFPDGFYADMARAVREKHVEAEAEKQRRSKQTLRDREMARLEEERRQARPQTSYWDHNGSLMRLATDGERRTFFYENPSSRMARAVATVDRLLFSGRQVGRRYEGTAYVYASRCRRKYGYQVKGDISGDGKRVVMRGAAPVIGSNCRVSRYDWNSNSTLVFSFQYAQ